ncbi:MAG: hypothetical protein ABW168_04105 [Sedimenticola sp.]
MYKNILFIVIISVFSVNTYAGSMPPLTPNTYARSMSPLAPITRIEPMVYQGEPGFFVNNCSPIGSACIPNYAGAAATGIAYWVPKSHALYETILSLSIASFAAGTPIQLHGSGACIPACSNGYEIIHRVDFRKKKTGHSPLLPPAMDSYR